MAKHHSQQKNMFPHVENSSNTEFQSQNSSSQVDVFGCHPNCQQMVSGRIPMQPGDECNWFLLESSQDEYAVQYTGPDPKSLLPMDIEGSEGLIEVVLNT
jgi:hypothetical protein